MLDRVVDSNLTGEGNLGSVLESLCECMSREKKYLFIVDAVLSSLFPSFSLLE
jgi:hypothetical protein